MKDFTKQVITIIKTIPEGKVMTYGQIASIAGNIRGARQVSRILHSMSDQYQLPWHRVINSRGGISLTGHLGFEQAQLLRNEGVVVNGKQINLKEYQYDFTEN
jgi:methylated-DNA-protein-cysteine methyltransferase-like protein